MYLAANTTVKNDPGLRPHFGPPSGKRGGLTRVYGLDRRATDVGGSWITRSPWTSDTPCALWTTRHSLNPGPIRTTSSQAFGGGSVPAVGAGTPVALSYTRKIVAGATPSPEPRLIAAISLPGNRTIVAAGTTAGAG